MIPKRHPPSAKKSVSIRQPEESHSEHEFDRASEMTGGITMKSPARTVDQKEDNNQTMYCFGDTNEVLAYTLGRFTWEKLRYDNNSSYDGNLKYMTCCSSQDGKIYMIGGVLTSNNHPSSTMYECNAR